MALMGCVGSRAHDALLHALEEAVKENALSRLDAMFVEGQIGSEEINQKHLLHQAAWLGYPRCVKLLLAHGANPNKIHKKNGCTPLHLAHFCTVDNSDSKQTIQALCEAGAVVNHVGGPKCSRLAIDHAIEHQRLDSVQALARLGSSITLQSVLFTIDVANPEILQTLLLHGAQCGRMLETVLYWGQPVQRVLDSPLKSPKECYKQMLQMLVQATVCRPVLGFSCNKEPRRQPSNYHLMMESEFRTLSTDSVDLTRYLYVYLLRNGFHPTEAIRNFAKEVLVEPDWVDSYLKSPVSLKDLSVRVIRSYLFLSGNVVCGASKLKIPTVLHNHILLINPY